MRPHALVVALLLAAGLSGCADDSPEGATARDLLQVANQQAQATDPSALLVSIQAFEVRAPRDDGRSQVPEESYRADPNVGDGRAIAWHYEFVRPESGERMIVIVHADGEVMAVIEDAQREDLWFEGSAPLAGWSVDSDDAAGIIKQAKDGYDRLASAADAIVGWALLGAETDATWVAWVSSGGGNPANARYFAVGATNGTYLGSFELEDLLVAFSLPPEESGSFDGTLSLLEPTAEHSFRIDHEGHEVLSVELRIEASVAGTVNITLLYEQEVVVSGDLGAGVGGSGFAQMSVDQPATGNWQIALRLENGAAQRYELDWCAPGLTIVVDANPVNRDPCG